MDLSSYKADFSLTNKFRRVIWGFAYIFLFRPFSLPFFRKWRLFILWIFGAKLDFTSLVYSSVKIWAPWNLSIGSYACIGQDVDCYNQGNISIGNHSVISQKSYLCASTHDITDAKHPLVKKPIIIEDQVWIAADAFIGPGVTVGQGAVVGARSAVFKNVDSWSVVGGNPAKFIKKRVIVK